MIDPRYLLLDISCILYEYKFPCSLYLAHFFHQTNSNSFETDLPMHDYKKKKKTERFQKFRKTFEQIKIYYAIFRYFVIYRIRKLSIQGEHILIKNRSFLFLYLHIILYLKDESDEIWKFDVLRSVRIERRRSTTT